MGSDIAEQKDVTLHSASLHAVVVLTCACGRGPLVITGLSEIAQCPSCASRYMIASITHVPVGANGQFKTDVQVGRLSDLALPASRAFRSMGGRS